MKRGVEKVPVTLSSDAQAWIGANGFATQMSQLYELIAEHIPETAQILVSLRSEPDDGSIARLVVELVTELDYKEFRTANVQLFDALYQINDTFPQFITLTRA